jgi:putative ABC transport system substrate-binding protein
MSFMSNLCHKHRWLVFFIPLFWLCSSQALSADLAQKRVLIINSDQSVGKYAIIQKEFESEINLKKTKIDLADDALSDRALKNIISKVRPHIVYAIGSKAYMQASTIIKDQPLIFSSMINWRRFVLKAKTYGIALELPVEMQLFMYSYLFPEIGTIGVLYSKSHNQQWFESAMSQAQDIGLTLHGQAIKKPSALPIKSPLKLPLLIFRKYPS